MTFDDLLIVGDGAVARALAAALPTAKRWHRRQNLALPIAHAAIIAVSDRAITEVATLVKNAIAPSVILHCAGSASAHTLLQDAAPAVGVLHPLRALRGPVESFAHTVFAIEGDPAATALATAIATTLGGEPLPLRADDLSRYHAAAVLAGNHVLGLLDAGTELLTSLGLESATAERALAGLFASAAHNASTLGIAAGLTGPIARGDVASVTAHRAALTAFPAIDTLYRESGLRLVDLAERAGRIDAATALALRDALYPR